MLHHLIGNWEISIDYRQWVIGFNYHPAYHGHNESIFNIFLGPIRIGWWSKGKKFWLGES
jgi:hypothetical protein